MTQPFTIPTWSLGSRRALGAGSPTLPRTANDCARIGQTIGIESIYFAKAAFEQFAAAAEKLAKAESPAAAFQIQADYARGACDRVVAQAATFRDLYVSLADAMTGGVRAAGAKTAGKGP